jgi:hypothetical protein
MVVVLEPIVLSFLYSCPVGDDYRFCLILKHYTRFAYSILEGIDMITGKNLPSFSGIGKWN